MKIDQHMMCVGQQISEDDDFAVLRVSKHDNVSFTIAEGDVFYTLMFVRQTDDKDGSMQPYHPFWHEDPEHFNG